MASTLLFWPDDQYDVDQASDGLSRYGAYLAQHRAKFRDPDGTLTLDRLEFAAAAWEIAQSPVMSPPNVRAHPRVQSARASWDDQGGMAVDVVVALPGAGLVPDGLRRRAVGWSRDRVQGTWYDPRDATRLTALAMLLVRVPVTPRDVLTPAYEHDNTPSLAAARGTVLAMCHLLNSALAGVLDGLD